MRKLFKISFKMLTRLINERSILLKIENYSFFHSLSMLLRKKKEDLNKMHDNS